MKERISTFDSSLAKVEAALATLVLLSMVVLATLQAFAWGAAQRLGGGFFETLLKQLSWVDIFLQKGTLWVAIIGGSLAAHHGKHLAIGLLRQTVSTRIASGLHVLLNSVSAVVALALAVVFYHGLSSKAAITPFRWELLIGKNRYHLCDVLKPGSRDLWTDAGCGVRWFFSLFGVELNDVVSAFDFIIPFGLLLISFRFLLAIFSDRPAEAT